MKIIFSLENKLFRNFKGPFSKAIDIKILIEPIVKKALNFEGINIIKGRYKVDKKKQNNPIPKKIIKYFQF